MDGKTCNQSKSLTYSLPRFVALWSYQTIASPHLRKSGIWEFFCCGIRNPGLWNQEFSSRNPESRIPSSIDKDSSIQYRESGTYSVESRIQDCLGFPYMERIANQFQKQQLLFHLLLWITHQTRLWILLTNSLAQMRVNQILDLSLEFWPVLSWWLSLYV